jgi:2-oxoisovalerate dehydrogenase E2 component (dihydrolipoyl transacylase)
MGRYLFRLPDIGEGVAEAEIVVWHVKPGDRIEEDHPLVDVMTEKATVDLTSPVDGMVTAIHGETGAMAPVGSVLVELEVAEGEAAKAAGEPAHRSPIALASTGTPTAPPPAEEAPLAAPATRRRARALGVLLADVPGTGPDGRITPADLDAYAAHAGQSTTSEARRADREGTRDIRIIGLRRKIAEQMQEATRRIPHFTYVEEFDLTELEALRHELNDHRAEGQAKLTLPPFFMRALVRVLPAFPQINARYDDEAGVLRTFEGVHIGVATQTAAGLMVPVVRHAEARDLWGCAAELARVTAAARDGSAPREVLSGSTITLTSLGPLGGVAHTPVINHPEVAIIGPNRLVERPMVRDGLIVVRKMMNVSSSFDHRIVDGHDAARFAQALKRLMEHPALIFMD